MICRPFFDFWKAGEASEQETREAYDKPSGQDRRCGVRRARSTSRRRTGPAVMQIIPGPRTESQEWAEMLLRMYRYVREKKLEPHGNWTCCRTGRPQGQERHHPVRRPFAYGFSRRRAGRTPPSGPPISPLDSNARAHTSFALRNSSPLVDDTSENRVSPARLEWEFSTAARKGRPER